MIKTYRQRYYHQWKMSYIKHQLLKKILKIHQYHVYSYAL